MLALWLRKAVVNGGTLLAIGPENGLYRDTAHWLRVPAGEEIGIVEELLAAREQQAEQAAPTATPSRPTPLAGRQPVRRDPRPRRQPGRRPDRRGHRGRCRRCRGRPGRVPGRRAPGGRSGGPRACWSGSPRRWAPRPRAACSARPSTTVNGRGALDLAGDIVAADREAGSAAAKAQAGELRPSCCSANEAWPATGTRARSWSPAAPSRPTTRSRWSCRRPPVRAGRLVHQPRRAGPGVPAGRPAAAAASPRTGCCWPA